MYHPRLKGSYYDMGHKYGALLYDKGVHFENLITLSDEELAFGLRSLDVLKEVYPGITEEIRGMAESQRFSYEKFAANLLTAGAFNKDFGCTCFCVTDKSGMYFVRNHDMFTSLRKTTESALYQPEGKNRFVGQSDAIIGKEDGVNEHGLAAGINFVAPKTVKPGLNFLFIIRYLLEHFKTVTDCLDWLQTIPVSTSQNIMLADRSGDMAVIELAAEKMTIRRPESGKNFIVSTNNFIHPEMTGYDNAPEADWFHSKTRYETVDRVLSADYGKEPIDHFMDIASGKHGFVCQYQRKLKFDTLWSFIVKLDDLTIIRAEGNPNRTGYKKETRLDWAMKKRAVQ